jgi:TRAP-type mannitol/chloroaromatic compound transport system permease large subunit
MGVMGALLLAALSRRLTPALIWQAMTGTMRLTAMVVFILIGSRVFSQVFQGVDGGKWVEHLLTGLPGGQVGFLIVVNIFVFFLAFFLDFFEIAFIIVPMLAPVAEKMGIDLIWFGVLLCVNLQTSFMHPPFGFALFYLRGIADTLFKDKRISKPVLSNDIYLGAIPWVIMQVILVVVVIFVPQSVTMFLDEKVVVDIDKVVIEMPVDEPMPNAELKPDDSGLNASPEDAIKAAAQAEADEQKKIDDLFKK